jgi:adenine-specific DNA-methyltransferase
MQRLKMHTPDITDENIEKIATLFPSCITETRQKNNRVMRAIDFDRLRQELSKSAIVDGPKERYQLNWPGKYDALVLANTPISETLRPCQEESVDFDNTRNLFIEGNNLEVLKLLQETYLNAVKMIYIDPPYNTGHDFIYKDDFRESRDTYLHKSQQVDDDGNRMKENLESYGRFHSDWLSMIYSRLRLAKNLLRADGVICISIDDNEVHNLRKICDEIFGSHNFIAQLIWNSEGHTDNQYDVKINHEYILLYGKTEKAVLGHVVDPNTRKDSNLWKGFAENSITKNGSANPPSEVILPKGFPCISSSVDISENCPPPSFFVLLQKNGYITRDMTKQFGVTYPIRKDHLFVEDSKLAQPCRMFSGWANVEKLQLFINGGFKPIDEGNGNVLSFYISDRGVIYYRRDREKAKNIVSVLRNMGTTEQMRSELESINIPFQYPKPKELISYLLRLGAESNCIVLDFFSGSATTAHSVIALNAEDGGKRRFIIVTSRTI